MECRSKKVGRESPWTARCTANDPECQRQTDTSPPPSCAQIEIHSPQINIMQTSSYEEMASYLRNIRPPNDYLLFDRTVRLVLLWFDTHKIREPKVFFEMEGKEYQAFVTFLTTQLGEAPTLLTKDFVKSMFQFARATL